MLFGVKSKGEDIDTISRSRGVVVVSLDKIEVSTFSGLESILTVKLNNSFNNRVVLVVNQKTRNSLETSPNIHRRTKTITSNSCKSVINPISNRNRNISYSNIMINRSNLVSKRSRNRSTGFINLSIKHNNVKSGNIITKIVFRSIGIGKNISSEKESSISIRL